MNAPRPSFSRYARSSAAERRVSSVCADETLAPEARRPDQQDGVRAARERLDVGLQRQPDIGRRAIATVRVAAGVVGRAKDLQHPEVRLVGHDTDNGVGFLVQANRPANGLRRPPERPHPQRLADQGHLRSPGLIFRDAERPAGHRRDAEHRQQAAAGDERRQPHGLALRRREIDLRANHALDRGERAAVALEVEQVGHRRRLARGPRVTVGLPDHHQAIDLGDRRRAQQHAVDDAEDGGRGANGQRQREDGHQREAGAAGQPPKRVTQIVEHAALQGLC